MPGRAHGSPRSRRRCGGGGAGEHAARRRVATMVARAAPPEEVFAAVAAEVGRLLAVDMTVVGRYGPDGLVTAVGGGSGSGGAVPGPAGWRPRGPSVASLVFETGRPARVDDFSSGPGVAAARSMGARAAV